MWNRIQSQTNANKVVGAMWPNDADGTAFRQGWPPYIKQAGYTLVDGGAYQDGQTDYTSMISQFKASNADFYVNGPIPPDFNVF